MTYEILLPPDSVRSRLAAAADRPNLRYWALPGTTTGRSIVGEVNGDRFWWRMRHQGQASFAPWLTGRVLSSGGGSTVLVELHSPITRGLQVFIGTVVVALAVLWFATSADKSAPAILVAFAAISLVIAFPLLGTWLFRGEQQSLRSAFEQVFTGAIGGEPRGY